MPLTQDDINAIAEAVVNRLTFASRETITMQDEINMTREQRLQLSKERVRAARKEQKNNKPTN